MKSAAAILLTKSEVESVCDLEDCITAVESAFRLRGGGHAPQPGILSFPYSEGGFHIKAAGLDLSRSYFAAKINGNFTQNPERYGLPAIQGVIVLCDAENGSPLALLDSIAITIARTGAATAVAAKYLARPESRVATICGCGNQGRVQLRALLNVCPIKRVYAYDADPSRVVLFANELSSLPLDIERARNLSEALRASDVIVTCTPSRDPFVSVEDVAPGTFVAAVGADSPEKQELDPRLLAESKIVVDIRDQCAEIGELHHGLASGQVSLESVHAELADIVTGNKPGRESSSEIIVFDSTGTALQDVAAAALVYERARLAGVGTVFRLGS
jgi:alanine dehydrogenase